ncbi:PREDICTED: probable palmitoyltransferase ZDHHC12 isoform X1 [Cercocebus atys]|uniref:probable palmitoyltransferase ZDHHC12 isoform X1 n=1 Tax=Cercocebus atys TaxID=9531 RepID=UPI0005F3DDC1|nr:PREDICTED: probable palmitoyltransferase ZDHHC12 isoform X1 [Cercocebus atys]XP_025216268.1 probable palmitoyltransferase ZDHHC12 isoform X1 [Theropithecus gelada]
MAPWALLSPGVLVRTGHTVLTWGITLVLFLHDTDKVQMNCWPHTTTHGTNISRSLLGQEHTSPPPTATQSHPLLFYPAQPHCALPASPELRQWEEQGELLLPLTFLLLVLGSLLLYLAVSLMDPGYVNAQPQPQEELKEEQTAMVPPAIPLRRCRYCLVLQPLRARHCRECRRCVRRYDHHCPWMENCVGERNHPLFVVYLALQLVVLLWGLYLAWSGLQFFQPWGLWLRSSGLLFATFLLLSLLSLVASLLLASHLYLVASNTTTWEFISSHRIAYLRQRPGNPFDRGLTRNLAHFFCGWPSGSWETLWAEEEEEGSSPAV